MLLVMIGLWQALQVEGHLERARSGVQHGVLSSRSSTKRGSGHWRARLRRVTSFPSREKVDEYLSTVIDPTLRELAEEQADVRECTDDEGRPCAELTVAVAESTEFVYRVSRREVPIPVYSGSLMPTSRDYYSRLEVHLQHEGGQGYDVMGYSPAQVIDDVLDAYEHHLEFLRIGEGPPV